MRARSCLPPLLPLLALLAVALAPGRVSAQAIDLVEVRALVTIEREAGEGVVHHVELRVIGTGITSASVTPPSGTAISLPKVGDDFVGELDFGSQIILDGAIPNGSYTLTLNGGTRTASIVYARPAVPSPAISAPDPNVVQVPGPTEVRFTRCSVCTESGDSVSAELLEGTTSLASATLTAADATWIPSDVGGPISLGEDSLFSARIVHETVRTSTLTTNTGGDSFTFSNTFTHSDEIVFATGFAVPVGDFCIVLNETTPASLDPLGECLQRADLELALVDPSGTIATTVGGLDVAYTLALAASGRISGLAQADLDDDGSLETSAELKGSLRGSARRLQQSLGFRLASVPLAAKLNVRVRDQISIPDALLSRLQRARGAVGATRIREDVPAVTVLPHDVLGWRLDFELDGTSRVQNASILLSSGRSVLLQGTSRFNLELGHANIRLASGGADRGVTVEVRRFRLDETGNVLRAELGYTILGQRGHVSLP